MFKFIKRLFHKTPSIGQMRTELECYGVKFSDRAFSTLTPRELKKLLRKTSRVWRKLQIIDSFIESREKQVTETKVQF